MTTAIIKANKFYFDSFFLPDTEIRIRTLYSIPAEEKIICALWSSVLLQNGFVLTDRNVHWFFKSDNNEVSGSFLKNADSAFTCTFKNILPEQKICKIEFSDGKSNAEFFFKNLSEKKALQLVEFLKNCAALESAPEKTDFPEPPFGPNTTNSFFKAVLFTSKKSEAIKDKWNSLFIKEGLKHSNKSSENESDKADSAAEKKSAPEADIDSEKQTKTSNPDDNKAEIQKSKVRFVFANIFDMLASVVFISMILLCIKCQLSPEFSNKDGLILPLGYAFISLKILTIFTAQYKNNKILPSLLLVMTILLVCVLVYFYMKNGKNQMHALFIFFLIFTVLFWICFNLSLEFSPETIKAKAKIIFILSLIIYTNILFFNDTIFAEAVVSLIYSLGTILEHLFFLA